MPIQRPTFQRPDPPSPDAAPTTVAITLGDPNGIGPEVVLKSLDDPELMPAMTPVLIGSAHVLRVHADVLGYSDLEVHTVEEVPDHVPSGHVAVLAVVVPQVDPGPGAVQQRAAGAAVGARSGEAGLLA